MARRIEEIILKVTLDDKKSVSQVSALDSTMKKADKSAASFNKTLLKVAAGLVAVVGGIRAVGKASDTALNFTKVENGLNTVFESSERVRKEWEFLTRVSDTLGLNVLDLSEQYTKVAAAAKDTSLEGKGARDVLVGVSMAATALSLSSEETAGALRAINQVMSKGKVQAEELRGQLGERIPGAFQIAARAMGVTTSELDKMLVSGKLLSEDFIPKFSAQLKEEFGAGALNAANKEMAIMNRITNDVTETWRRLGVVANSFLPFIANTVIPMVTNAIENMIDTSLDWAEIILPEILTVASGVFGGIATFLDALGDVAGAVFGFIGEGWNLLFENITGDSNWVDSITGFLTVAAQAWPQLLVNPFLIAGKFIADIISDLGEKWFSLQDAISQEALVVATTFGTLSEADFLVASTDLFEAGQARRREGNIFDSVSDDLKGLIDENNTTIQQFADAAVGDRADNKGSISEAIDAIRDKIKNVFTGDLKSGKIERDRDRDKQADRSKLPKFNASGPLTSSFEVGTAAASEFLKTNEVNLEQLDVMKKIEKNTKNQTELIAK